MNLKLNKEFSILISGVLIILYFIGLPITYQVLVFNMDNSSDPTWLSLLEANLVWTIRNLDNLILGWWLFFNAHTLRQDRWTWLVIGLLYGKYALVLVFIIMIVQNDTSKKDLFKSMQKIMIAIGITFLLTFVSDPLFNYFIKTTETGLNVGFIMLCSSYLRIVPSVLFFLLNIVLAYRFSLWLRSVSISGKSIWVLATVCMGIFPLIIFNQLMILKNDIEKVTLN